MRSSRFSEEQIIGMLKEQEAGSLNRLSLQPEGIAVSGQSLEPRSSQLQELARYASTFGSAFRRIDAVTKFGDGFECWI